MSQRQSRPCHRFDLGHRVRHRPRLRAGGADVCINGFGDAAAIEKERSSIESDFGVKAIYDGADMSKGSECAGDDY